MKPEIFVSIFCPECGGWNGGPICNTCKGEDIIKFKLNISEKQIKKLINKYATEEAKNIFNNIKQ
jgi:hypothetical protein